jgi:polysaccharide deacetylase family sporulation protein PdaB
MKRNVIYAVLFVAVLFSLWTFKDSISRKPAPDKDFSPGITDLAGGPERKTRGFPKRENIDLSSMFPDLVYNSGSSDEKKIALTFDDGPDNVFTPQMLDILKENDVKATFFIMGKRAEDFPAVFKRMVNEGHLIANHSWSHPNFMKLSNEKIKEELTKTNDLIKEYTEEDSNFFRSPYGSIDPERVKFIGEMGYKIIAWNVDSLDWKGLSAEEVSTNILENTTNGSIILQHSAGGKGEDLSGSVKALAKIIDVLKKDGFMFVTVDKLLTNTENCKPDA